uniref:Protein kinase domain-containing protein n=1 Tax=Nothobranchius furzeri TaxID=105023 RepID=A0A8C6KMZ3_NOTFU
MENFILYEKLGTGRTSVVYKGRRKGHLSYVAIICTDKSKRPLVTNHVRLSQDLEHPHITHFYEWYETSNHLWLVAELCTGGSLEFVIARDGRLPEGVVRSFGWGLVKGLKHIHELGVILSDLTPAKILLDGSGILKFSNFYLSKAEGERLEDIFKLLSTSEEAGERRENFDHLRKKLQGCPTYSAPEVLQGSETSVRSDLWALGCILYYMCAGTHSIRAKTRACTESHSESDFMSKYFFIFLFKHHAKHRFSSSNSTETLTSLYYTVCSISILKSPPVRFDSKTLCVPAYSVEKLLSLSDDEWTAFILQLHSCFEEQKSSVLNLLCYLCCVAGNTVVANRLMNSSLLVALTQQLRQAPNWDVRSKVLRLMGLLALHCDLLEEDSSVSEAVSTMTDLLRENLRNSKLKQFVLPPLGEFLYLISSQEEKRGSPEGLWFIPTTAYTGLMRSLREGDDAVSHHMAVKTIENIFATDSGLSQHLATTEMGSALWYLFTHSTVEAVRVTAISALSRLTRLDPAVFLSVMDTCGPAAILEGIGGAGARVQQHLLTAVASALLTSHIQTNRITQITYVKMAWNSWMCLSRLVMYLERDLRKATPLRENPSQSGYLGQCLDLLLGHLSATAPVIMEDVLNALGGVIGRRHPSAAQSKQLKQTLPTVSVVLGLLSSQVDRAQIIFSIFERVSYILTAARISLSLHIGITFIAQLFFSKHCLLFLMFRFESLLTGPEPVPLYALKLLVSMTEHSSQICRYFTFKLHNVKFFLLLLLGVIEVVSISLWCRHEDLIYKNRCNQTDRRVRVKNKCFFPTFVFPQLSGENQDVWEESLQCLSLLVQLYAGEGQDCLSPSCLQSFSHILRTNASTKSLQTQSTTLRIIKRLVINVSLPLRHDSSDLTLTIKRLV